MPIFWKVQRDCFIFHFPHTKAFYLPWRHLLFLIIQHPLPHFSVRATSFMWVPISPMERWHVSQKPSGPSYGVGKKAQALAVFLTPGTGLEGVMWPELVHESEAQDGGLSGGAALSHKKRGTMPLQEQQPRSNRQLSSIHVGDNSRGRERQQRDPWRHWVNQWIKTKISGFLVLWNQIVQLF